MSRDAKLISILVYFPVGATRLDGWTATWSNPCSPTNTSSPSYRCRICFILAKSRFLLRFICFLLVLVKVYFVKFAYINGIRHFFFKLCLWWIYVRNYLIELLEIIITIEFFLNECHWIQQIQWIMTKSKNTIVTTSTAYLYVVMFTVIKIAL